MAIRALLGLLLACGFISGITGDVPDGVVYTDLHLKAQLGSRAVLICHFYGTPSAVYWKKGDNPSTAPNLIFWVEGEPEFGSCVKDKTCEMGDDYSLIIKNVSIVDQGRYICRVSNYKGILLHNFTDVKVLAPPEEPYPFINECKENQGQNCILLATGPVNITCTVLKYFPNVDLSFLHGIKKYSTVDTLEWTNTDGRKSKSIFTTAPPSEIPYGCVAFNIPGSQEQRTATVTVPDQSDAATTMTTPTSPSSRLPRPSEIDGPIERNKYFVIEIVVPLAMCGGALILLCLLVASCWICKRRRNHDTPYYNCTTEETQHLLQDCTTEEMQHLLQGPVSLYELWYLASYKKSEDHKKKLRKVLIELDISDVKEGQLTPLETYNALCTWRRGKDKAKQLKALEKAFGKVRYSGAWTDVDGRRKDKSIHVSSEKLTRILQHIGNIRHLNQFLNLLIKDRTNIDEEMVYDLQVRCCLKELTEWVSSRQYKFNPFVLLSLALEKVGCTALDMVDFWVPENLESPITDDGLEKFLNELTARHCKRLAMYLKIQLKNLIILGNNRYLFDTKSMITDWLNVKECRNFRKRCRLDDTIIKIGRYDLHDRFETVSYRDGAGLLGEHPHPGPHPNPHQFDAESIYDDDIPHLAKMIRCIPPDKKIHFQEKTGLNPDDNAADDTLEERIKTWRDSVMAKRSKDQSLNEFRSLRQELNNKKYSECIGSKSNKKRVTREELPRIALDLLMEDVRPIIEALDIDQSTVHKYVKQWDGKGSCTIELVKELLKNRGRLLTTARDREDFCQVLRNIGFIDVARSVYSGLYETESQEGSSSAADMHSE